IMNGKQQYLLNKNCLYFIFYHGKIIFTITKKIKSLFVVLYLPQRKKRLVVIYVFLIVSLLKLLNKNVKKGLLIMESSPFSFSNFIYFSSLYNKTLLFG